MTKQGVPRSSRTTFVPLVVGCLAVLFLLAASFPRTRLEQGLGAMLVLATLLDMFLTVLYARMGYGILGIPFARLTWRGFRLTARLFRDPRLLMSLCGPTILVVLVAVWSAMLALGAALLMHRALGTGIVLQGEGTPTPTDFVSALYAAGNSVSVVGTSEFGPATSGWRIVVLFFSFVGVGTLSLVVTYFTQLYTALGERNTLGLKMHLLSAETGDAAEIIAGLGPEGRFEPAFSTFAEMAAELSKVKEAHHLYPVLFYYRFHEPFYAVSRVALLALDTATLLTTALRGKDSTWVRESAAVVQLRLAALHLTRTLQETFLDGLHDPTHPDAETEARWKQRFHAAVRRLREAGIETCSGADEEASALRYVELRAGWEAHVEELAPAMCFSVEEIDPMGRQDPHGSDRRAPFRSRRDAFA